MKRIFFLILLASMALPAIGQVVSTRTAPVHLKVSAGSMRAADINRGRYHALIIGVQQYQAPSLNTLEMPLANAKSFKEVLIRHYQVDWRSEARHQVGYI